MARANIINDVLGALQSVARKQTEQILESIRTAHRAGQLFPTPGEVFVIERERGEVFVSAGHVREVVPNIEEQVLELIRTAHQAGNLSPSPDGNRKVFVIAQGGREIFVSAARVRVALGL